MIDNYEKAMELVETMNEHLPIPARPTTELIQAIEDTESKLTKGQDLQIDSVFYMGDEGGICCSISMPKDSKSVLVTSITHLRIKASHLLAREIRSYQKKRIKTLVKSQF